MNSETNHFDYDPPIQGERVTLDLPGGRLSVYVSGEGAPLLLVHSINAAASAAEVKPLIDKFASNRQVFSIDLPGFGLSERKDIVYTPRLMIDAIRGMVEFVKARNSLPIDALAVSLSCEFLARLASEEASLFRTIALLARRVFPGELRCGASPAPPALSPGFTRRSPVHASVGVLPSFVN